MSITDELRAWAKEHLSRSSILAIADRIDAEYESAIMGVMNDALYYANEDKMAELGWIRLPKDADGVAIHIGDMMEWTTSYLGVPNVFEVQRIIMDPSGWHLVAYPATYAPEECCHHHAPTVEDVLREMLKKWGDAPWDSTNDDEEALVAEFAAKLRLAGDEGADTCQA